ncbi:MAG: Gfo/Idh/MocA family oxidoreductase [Bdellovibrionales bacterium]|nr:Gfo/Idh/MocA family oxidoreductase [Bdellovibrionales bacterium]
MTMTTPLRCAVVGVGYLGRFHAQKYAALPEAQLVAVCDPREEQGQAVAQELKVPWLANYRELVGKVDAVTVAATTSAHFEIAKYFLENGIHVHVEKPMTSTSVEGEELCQLAERKNLKLQVGHIERFNPAFVAAREKLKRPLFIECHRLAPFKPRGFDVSVVLDLMIHDLDVILSLVNSPPVGVTAVGTPVITNAIDIANARVEFASGTVANITASRVSQKSERKFRVFQGSQYLSLDFGAGEIRVLTKTGEWGGDKLPLEQEVWSLEKGDALLAETAAFVKSVREDLPCVVTGRDGLVALKLAEQVERDIRERLGRVESR